jgi:hypothetical protein
VNWFPEFYTKDFDMGSKPVLFSYTDGVDKLLLLFGTLGSIGDGLMTPLFFFFLLNGTSLNSKSNTREISKPCLFKKSWEIVREIHNRGETRRDQLG